jgi:ClpP class serine protease
MSKPHALDHVLSLVALPWAMEPTALAFAWSVVEQRLINGPRVEPLELKAFDLGRDEDDDDDESAPPGVAILPIHGVLAPRINLLSGISGGTTFQGIERDLGKALAAPQVKTIVLDINSPGGSVFGVRSCARAILAARAQKPVIAHIHPQGNSAAYWLASCATEVVAEGSAMVGSVGVFLAHDNIVGMLTKAGIERTLIAFGESKLDGNPSQPLSDRAKARLQALCDLHGGHFVADVAGGQQGNRKVLPLVRYPLCHLTIAKNVLGLSPGFFPPYFSWLHILPVCSGDGDAADEFWRNVIADAVV